MHVKIRKRIGNPTLYNAKINYSRLLEMVSRNFAYWNYYCLFLRDNNEMSYAFLHVYSTLTSSIFNYELTEVEVV